MKHLGLTTTLGGMIYAVDRIIGIATPPFLGAISDKSQSPKAVLLWVMLTGALLSASHCFVPPVENQTPYKCITNDSSIQLDEFINSTYVSCENLLTKDNTNSL